MLSLACEVAIPDHLAAVGAPARRSLLVAGLVVQITEPAMFGTGQAYPFLFWIAVAAALLQRSPRALASPPPVLEAQLTTAGTFH